MDRASSSRRYLESAAAAMRGFVELSTAIDAIIEQAVSTLRAGSKVLTCGNGGSAAEAMHLAEEMIGRYRQTRPPLAAICLSADSTALTCIANDWDYSEVFARQVDALGRAGDALIVLSTSGKSPSILRALAQARMAGLVTIGLLGPAGSPATELCDLALCVDDQTPASHIQELHLAVIHAILERLDFEFGAA